MTDWGGEIKVDVPRQSARYDGLLLPGGAMNPGKRRVLPAAVACVKHFFQSGKPVASICHGPGTLVEADAVRGRKVTSRPTRASSPAASPTIYQLSMSKCCTSSRWVRATA
jgi:protease I